ncbi:hypothetical protein [Fodinibius sp.]|uniref:hypothetical protein n=1 Tax=Fodinibius sp. TaxID=1872440 RepID=UPI002ACE690D|nr:hypothetical protein [Fodinibius sp.]MDZ7659066.1 hypothetical protein [Fodinibius sp.]
MKTLQHITKSLSLVLLLIFGAVGIASAQFDRDMQYYTNPDQTGLNQFEAPFETDVEFDGLNVRLGGANTLQFQGISHDNDAGSLPELESNFNLATSNLDFDVALANGLRMHLRTYLSSQHHEDAWVKGGYIQVDRLDFISEGFASGLMENLRFKVGHMELNYGDAHFRRTDNAAAIHNPFVGNYIMDSFTTEVSGEVYIHSNGLFGMLGLSNGKLNQSTMKSNSSVTFYTKLGIDKQVNENLRYRLTGSYLTSGESVYQYLYHGDRAGSRYYNVMDDGFTSGRFAPGFTVSSFAPNGPIAGEMSAIMINPFIKFGGLEFFGLFETTSGQLATESSDRSYNQYGAELLYRFGAEEDVYLGTRYNLVDGSDTNQEISRFNIGGGWFLTKNVLAKLEYVTQSYSGDGYAGTKYEGGEFNGVMLEAVISF